MSEVDLQGHLWGRVTGLTPEGGMWKVQYCPRKLVPLLIEDMTIRGVSDLKVEGCDEGFIDQPGMIMVDRTHQKIKLDTLSLEIPTQDFEQFFYEIQNSYSIRTFSDGSQYYKIHGWRAAILLSPEQRDLLLKGMEEMLSSVLPSARREDLEFEKRLVKVNEGKVKVVSIRPMRHLPSFGDNGEELN